MAAPSPNVSQEYTKITKHCADYEYLKHTLKKILQECTALMTENS